MYSLCSLMYLSRSLSLWMMIGCCGSGCKVGNRFFRLGNCVLLSDDRPPRQHIWNGGAAGQRRVSGTDWLPEPAA